MYIFLCRVKKQTMAMMHTLFVT